MKHITIVGVVFIFTMCNAQHKDKKIITEFLEQIILNESYEIENIDTYLDINKDALAEKRERIYKLLQMHIVELRENLKSNDVNYEIISHNSSKDSRYIKAYNLSYDTYTKVYYLLNDKGVITHFVMHKGKIRSFFCGIVKKDDKRVPWLLNNEQ
jgi:hypothetical protein